MAITNKDSLKRLEDRLVKFKEAGGKASGGVRSADWLEENLGAAGLTSQEKAAGYYVPGISSAAGVKERFGDLTAPGGGMAGSSVRGETQITGGKAREVFSMPESDARRLTVEAALTQADYDRKALAGMRETISGAIRSATKESLPAVVAAQIPGSRRKSASAELDAAVSMGLTRGDLDTMAAFAFQEAGQQNERLRNPALPPEPTKEQRASEAAGRKASFEDLLRRINPKVLTEALLKRAAPVASYNRFTANEPNAPVYNPGPLVNPLFL